MDLINKNIRVLVADDDPDEHAKFIRAINSCAPDAKTDSVYNGMQLLDHLSKLEVLKKIKPLPDLVITDLYMPFAGGLQVLKQIKQHPAYRQIPIYVFSKNYDATIRSKVISNGASEFYRKPAEFNDLKEIVNHILIKTSLSVVQ